MNATVLGILWMLGHAEVVPMQAVAEQTPTRERNGLIVQWMGRYTNTEMSAVSLAYDQHVGDRPLWIRPQLGWAVRMDQPQGDRSALLLGFGVAYGHRFRATADGYFAVGLRDRLFLEGVEVANHWGADLSAAVGAEFMSRSGYTLRVGYGVAYLPKLAPFSDYQTWNAIAVVNLGIKF